MRWSELIFFMLDLQRMFCDFYISCLVKHVCLWWPRNTFDRVGRWPCCSMLSLSFDVWPPSGPFWILFQNRFFDLPWPSLTKMTLSTISRICLCRYFFSFFFPTSSFSPALFYFTRPTMHTGYASLLLAADRPCLHQEAQVLCSGRFCFH